MSRSKRPDTNGQSREKDLTSRVEVQDEILQIMYWMRGEGFAYKISAAEIARLLTVSPREIQSVLRSLADLNWVSVSSGPDAEEFTLTERGVEEGKRRFMDEFHPYLGKESHLTCDDPLCDCHSPDWDGDCLSTSLH